MKTLRERMSQGIELTLLKEGKQWRAKVVLHCVSKSDAVSLLSGLVADMQAECEGEAMKAAREYREQRKAA